MILLRYLSIFYFTLLLSQPLAANELPLEPDNLILPLDYKLDGSVGSARQLTTSKIIDQTEHWLEKIWREGREEIYVSGYAYHDPHTYSAEKRASLNNYAVGGGYARTIVSDRGNEHSLYALAFIDSHKNFQPNIGYAYQAIWGDRIRFGAGASVLIARRRDVFEGVPFPAIMPLFSIGTENTSIMFVPIPKLSNSQNANNGNVLFVFGKFTYK